MSQLPEPRFIETDQQAVLESCIREYEELAGRTLYPAQAERLLINLIAYREHLVRVGIQEAAKQNLVRYAQAPMLDMLGELVGVTRLAAEPASCTIRFALKEALAADLDIPAGVKIYSQDGSARFDTGEACRIGAGELSVEVHAYAADAGEAANGILPGGVCQLADPLADADVSAANVDATGGGSDAEDDEHLRERIMLAPEAFSVAGSKLAYRYHALSASPSIVDVHVWSPEPGVVSLVVLTEDGVPSPALLAVVEAYLSGEKIRPLTDTVKVSGPEKIDLDLEAELTLYTWADEEETLRLARTAFASLADDYRLTLGKDVVRTQLVAALSVYGVYRVRLVSPAEDRELDGGQWALWRNVTISAARERKDG